MDHVEAFNGLSSYRAYDPPQDILDDDGPDQDVEMDDMAHRGPGEVPEQSERLIVAVDFGTTFSSVAYATVTSNRRKELITLKDVKCITNYPDDLQATASDPIYGPSKAREDVPTELWYSDVTLDDPDQGIDEEEHYEDGNSASETNSSSGESSQLHEEGTEMEGVQNISMHEMRGSMHMFWGFGVQDELGKIDQPKDGAGRLSRFKLMLEPKRDETKDVRETLKPTMKRLKMKGVVSGIVEVITDYLEQLLRHTKSELERIGLYRYGMDLEFVLCVPAVWPYKAVLDMQTAMTDAVKRCEFGTVADGVLDNLFIVSEPEAAAMCVLAEQNSRVQVR
jgi:hypothetical protein